MNEKMGQIIFNKRKDRGITQEEFAEKPGVSRSAVSRWENGKTLPDTYLLPLISKILDLPITSLFDLENYEREFKQQTE